MSPNPALLTWPRPVAGGSGSLSGEFVDISTSTSDVATYTFASMDLGSAAVDRTIVVVAGYRAAAARTVTALTVAGSAVTVDAFRNHLNTCIAIGHVALPSGVSGDVVLTLSGQAVRAGAAVYRITGDSVGVASIGTGTNSTTVTGAADGFIVAGCFQGSAGTWTNATADASEPTEDYYLNVANAVAVGSTSISQSSSLIPALAAVAYAPA